MKHNIKITLSLLLIFFIAQLIGLQIISQYININESTETGKTVIYQENYIVEPPKVENESFSFLYFILPFLIGTAILLLIIKFNLGLFWKFWFSLSVFLALFMAFYPFSKSITIKPEILTITIAIILTFFKDKNSIIHNVTEIFIYGGIAAIFVPILNLFSISVLLILISAYDAFAVWKSKHMVKLAKFQTESRMFAGISLGKAVTKKKKSESPSKKGKKTSSAAILGGGDVAFPLLFAGVVLKYTASYASAIVISIGATIALGILLLHSKKEKFYPAMPFISAGCFIALALTQFF